MSLYLKDLVKPYTREELTIAVTELVMCGRRGQALMVVDCRLNALRAPGQTEDLQYKKYLESLQKVFSSSV